MEQFIQKITSMLKVHFAGCDVEIERVGARRVGGVLIWDGFEAREQIDRQREVWRMLRTHLSPKQQERVSAILTLTEEEAAAARQV